MSNARMSNARPPLPPFTRATAVQKVRLAEDGWNSRDPERVSLAYSTDSYWRNRAEFVRGRPEIVAFLTRKWARELDYRLIKELWAFTDDRIAVRFAYEWHDDAGNWLRSYGNENWEFDDDGLMRRRLASINDLPIKEATASISGRSAPALPTIPACPNWGSDGWGILRLRRCNISLVQQMSLPGLTGQSSTPGLRLLDRPVEPRDDSEACVAVPLGCSRQRRRMSSGLARERFGSSYPLWIMMRYISRCASSNHQHSLL